MSIEQVVHLLKGSSSHWINQNRLCRGNFAWGRGYGAFSVSHSDVDRVANYIAKQEEHHRKRSFAQEYELFVKRSPWNGATKETVETVKENFGGALSPG